MDDRERQSAGVPVGGRPASPAIGWCLAVACVVVPSACTDRADSVTAETESVIRRDSAGVEIVENRAPHRFLAVEQVLRIGVVDGDPRYQFSEIRDVAVSADGTIWVVDDGPAVRRFGANGEYLGEVGARGEGPGESARGYAAVWPLGSHVVVETNRTLVAQRFSLDGALIESTPRVRSDPPRVFVPIGPVDSDWYFQEYIQVEDSVSGPRRDWIVSSGPIGGADLDPIVRLRGRQMEYRQILGTRSPSFSSWFEGIPSLAVTPDGRIFYAPGATYRIEQYSAAGDLLRVVVRSVDPVPYSPLPGSDLEEAVWAWLRGSSPGGEYIGMADEVASVVQAAVPNRPIDHLPFIDRILAGPDGALWVERGDEPTRPIMRVVQQGQGRQRWAWDPELLVGPVFDAFGSGGEYLGTVELPERFLAYELTGDRIYGVIIDEFEVQFVVAFEVGEG